MVRKYQTTLEQLCLHHNIFHKMDRLHIRTTYPLSHVLAEEYEYIDIVIEELMEEAEKNFANYEQGRYDGRRHTKKYVSD